MKPSRETGQGKAYKASTLHKELQATKEHWEQEGWYLPLIDVSLVNIHTRYFIWTQQVIWEFICI